MGEAQTHSSVSETQLCTSHEVEPQDDAPHFKKPETGHKPSGIETRWDYYATPIGGQLAWASDLEPEGLLLRTLDLIPARRWIRLRFRLPTLGIPLITTAQVVTSGTSARGGIARFEARVKFRTPVRWIRPLPDRYLKPEQLKDATPEELSVLRASCAALLSPILDSREMQERLGLPG